MAKIMIVLHDLRGGGAEKMMVRLANQLAKEGDEVNLVLLTEGGVNKSFLTENVELTELDARRTMLAVSPLRRHIRQNQPDAILSVLTHVNVVAALACFSLGLTKILTVSERNNFSMDKNVNSGWVMKATYLIAPLVYRLLPNPVIAVSRGVADDLIGHSIVRDKDVVTAPNPVITEQTEAAAQQPPAHPWLRDKSLPVIVALGRLSHQKGFDMLLNAMSKLQQHVNCRLVIFGEGELREPLQQIANELGIEERVSFAGYTDNPLAEIRCADLFVLSSRFEGSPNGLVEAMSVDTPVVAFDCPHGPREILRKKLADNLVEYKNVDSLVQVIKRELNQQSKNTGLFKQAVEIYRAAVSAEKYRNLLLARD